MAFGFGWFLWPHLWARIIASRERRNLWTIPLGTIVGKALFLVVITPLVAVVAADLWPTVEALGDYRPDQIIIRFMLEYLPLPLAALMLAGVSAAAMSTVDSLSLVLSSIVFHDLYERLFGTRLSEQRKTTWARIVTALFPASATLIALHPPGLIVGLVIDTSYTALYRPGSLRHPGLLLAEGLHPGGSLVDWNWVGDCPDHHWLVEKPLWSGCLQRFLDPDDLYGGAGFRLPVHAAPLPGGPGVL